MVTVKDGPYHNLPTVNAADGTEYEDHPFFEASSVRKINGKYYFIYSSCLMHELCWAVSDTPLGEYRFGGVLVSNADIGVDGNTEALNYRGNTHGSVAFVNGKWYVFYHRQTNRHFFSRQACAEQIRFDGEQFYQAEITSCGLNGGPLKDEGTYEARIACHLYGKTGATESQPDQQDENHPAFTQEGEDREDNPNQYISNMTDGATAGYRYFEIKNAKQLTVEIRGTADGMFTVRDGRNGPIAARIPVSPSETWSTHSAPLSLDRGTHALYFTYEGRGFADFKSFRFN
jgi:hypothetical protein